MLSDDELDEYVASLLTNRAQRQSAAYSTLGFRAFLKDAAKDGPVGKPNTRFLKNIVRDVDGYNAALARKEERESLEKLKDLRRRDGDKLSAYKEKSSRREEEEWRARRERDRGRSRSPRRSRDRDSDERDRRRTSRRDDSREEERRERRHGESRRKRRSQREESEDDEDRSRQRRKHRERQRDSDDEGRRRHRYRDHGGQRHSNREGDSNDRRSDDTKERQRKDPTRKSRHSSSKRDMSPRHGSHRSHRRHNSSHLSSEDDSKHKSKSDKRHPPSESDSDSIGPESPVHGPDFRIAKGRGKMNGGTLDAKFSDAYDPRKDTPGEEPDSDHETDDWGVALRALRERQSFILSGAMTERLAETQKETQPSGWPTYSKGEREWDKGKVVLDDGSVGVKVWGVEKPL